jgi:hypothetical protein
MPWQELTKIALLGTEHSTISEGTLQILQAQGIDVSKEAPLVLAEGAALYAQLRKAGFRLEDFTGQLPEMAAAADEKVCSMKSANHLNLILGGQFEAVLAEFFEHLIKNKKCLPPEHLPKLLQRPDTGKWIGALDEVLSSGGRWLLAQHPAWRVFIEKPVCDWHTASRDERLRLLAFLRKNDPPAGLALVQSTWNEEQYADKKAFLILLQWGLTVADESFLESCLDDGRKEVRRTASNVLRELPDSRLCGRMYDRAVACFQWDKTDLKLAMPEDVNPEEERDGIVKIDPNWKGGAKAAYLGQVVSAVPPGRWEVFFIKTPVDILQIFAGTDWAGTLLVATAAAAVQHGDGVWLDALLSWWFEHENLPLWNSEVTSQLLKAAPAATTNRLARQFLLRQNGLPDDSSPVFKLLKNNANPWENDLTMLIVRRLQDWMLKTNRQDWQSFHYKEFLKMAAVRCDPDLLKDLQKGWPVDSPLWAFWEKPVEEMLNILLFRMEMIKELSDSGSPAQTNLPVH